jgi:3',5'-cyclic AMP phosphodiesterase CpdA
MALLADVHLAVEPSSELGAEFGYTAELLRDAVQRIWPMNLDQLTVVGDLVDRGTPPEYELARQIFEDLTLPIRTIPGNHEFIRGTSAEFLNHCIGATMGVAECHDDISMLWINSGIENMDNRKWHGRVDSPGLELIDRAMVEHPGKPLLVFCHHPPEATVLVPNHPMMNLINSDELMSRLQRHPSPVVLFCGHTHVQDIWRRRNLTIVGCPPLSFWPHAFLTVEIRDGWLHLDTHRLIDSPEASPDIHLSNPEYLPEREPWATRLSMRLQTIQRADPG